MKNKSPILLRIISLIFLIGWMGLIFYMSHQNASVSSGMSGNLIKNVVRFFIPQISESDLLSIVSAMQFIVRKTAHFAFYAILGILSFIHISTYKSLPIKAWFFLSLVVSMLYSASDEYHQTFVAGRSGELRDILIDTLGALTGIIFALIIYKIHRAIKNRRKPKMKKKQYIELVENLQKRLVNEQNEWESLNAENSRLRRENSDLNRQLEELRQRISAIEVGQEIKKEITELPKAEDTAIIQTVSQDEPQLRDGISLGSKIIGKIVLSSAEYCNRLTDVGAASNAKELVNLILGRTEVAKAEILRLSALELDNETMLSAMERELNEAEDYFKSVMAQK